MDIKDIIEYIKTKVNVVGVEQQSNSLRVFMTDKIAICFGGQDLAKDVTKELIDARIKNALATYNKML